MVKVPDVGSGNYRALKAVGLTFGVGKMVESVEADESRHSRTWNRTISRSLGGDQLAKPDEQEAARYYDLH